jgi:hypothetical protein
MSNTVECQSVRPPFADVFLKQAAANPNLGPAYFDAQAVVDAAFPDEASGPIIEAMQPVIKKFVDDAYEALLERAQDYLFSNIKDNLQQNVWRMVDASVMGVLGGDKWAVQQFVLDDRYDCKEARRVLAALIPVELQDKRMAELEAELAKAKDENRRLLDMRR